MINTFAITIFHTHKFLTSTVFSISFFLLLDVYIYIGIRILFNEKKNSRKLMKIKILLFFPSRV